MKNKPKVPVVALVGRPNVGKSTLFNRLSGKKTALVRDDPGITRDRHYALCEWEGITMRLIDTAGMTVKSEKNLDQKMTEQAVLGSEEADVVVCILDGRAELTQQDFDWINWTRSLKKPKFYVINKMDDEKTILNTSLYETGITDQCLMLASEGGRGLSELLDALVAISKKLYPDIELASQPSDDDELPAEEPDEIPSVALIGRPNVGKSTLLNALLGYDRVVVDDTPGTTRDPIDSLVNIDGEDYLFIDTAGLKKKGQTTEVIDKFSAVKTLKVIDRAEYVFALVDANDGITEQDSHVIGEAFKKHKAIILLVNKWDEAQHGHKREEILNEIMRKLQFISYVPILFISAKKKMGLDKVFATLKQVREEYENRVPTSKLNEVFEEIVYNHPLPVYAGKNIKIYFATQVGIKPPAFVVFSNNPSHIHFSYERYLVNSLRKAFGYEKVPLKIMFRKK
ncbi:MAG: hypothetical protein ACD_73C00081G0001 [uncultured bacterium]|nr:MAG: hypothetical protein ACD_73C00081G0001 [uncultured bacterium]